MIVVSASTGIALVFEDEEDMKKVIMHLTGLMEYKGMKDSKPYPAVYSIFRGSLPKEEAKSFNDRVHAMGKVR